MGKCFMHNTLNFTAEREIEAKIGPIPYYAVADEAFPLLKNLMHPGKGFPEGGRHMIENTFGIMASKWRIFRKPIIAGQNTVNAVTRAAVVLHNFIKMSEKNDGVRYYSDPLHIEFVQRDQWRSQEMGALALVNQLGTNTYSADAKIIRNKLKNNFLAEGTGGGTGLASRCAFNKSCSKLSIFGSENLLYSSLKETKLPDDQMVPTTIN